MKKKILLVLGLIATLNFTGCDLIKTSLNNEPPTPRLPGISETSNTFGTLLFTNSDFESADFTNWTATGDYGLYTCSNETAWWNGEFNKGGNYFFRSITDASNNNADGNTGTLTSTIFKIGVDWTAISFLAGGGNSENTYVRIVSEDGSTEIYKKYDLGDTEKMSRVTVNLGSISGLDRNLNYKIEIVDNETGGWGVINVDDFRYSVATVSGGGNDILNGGFETGDLTGWTIVSGDAFSNAGVISDSTYWNEGITYNQDGAYHFGIYNEGGTGIMKSSTFTLSDSGWISFKLGAAKNDTTYISIKKSSDNTEIARFKNSEFADVNFPNVDLGLRLANMVEYKYDLSAYLGEDLYVEVTDNATGDWGLLTLDAFDMNHASEPTNLGIVTAIDIK